MSARNSVPAIDTGSIRPGARSESWPLHLGYARRRRPLGRRIAKLAGYFVGGLVVLAVLALGFLHTPWGKSFVRGRIEKALAAKINGTVRVGSLDYGVLFGTIALGDIEIRDASGRKAIEIGSIDLALDRGALLHREVILDELALAGLDVDIVKHADGTSNLTGLFKASKGKPLGHVQIGRLAVSGSASVTKSNGRTIAVREISIAGRVDARPAARQVALAFDRIAAQVETAGRHVDIAVEGVSVTRGGDQLELDIATIAAGCLTIEKVAAHVALDHGKPRGEQTITIGKARVDSEQLAALVGHAVLLDDIALDLSLTGPAHALALRGAVRTRDTSLTLDGTLDVAAATPRYQLALVAAGRSADVLVPRPGKQLPAIATGVRVDVNGQGVTPADVDAEIAVAVDPTTIGKLAVDGLIASATAKHGSYRLDRLVARGIGFEVTASGQLAGTTVNARLDVSGNPARALDVLAAAGIAVPREVPRIGRLDLAVTARGSLDGELAVMLEPTTIALAGGSVAIAGDATLERKRLRVAHTQITLAQLDLASLSRLAGRPPKANGSLSGTLALTRTAASRHATYDVAVALHDKPLVITATGEAGTTSATAHAEVRRTSDRAVIASLGAQLPLDAKGLVPSGPWHVTVDVARRQLADLASLLPPRLRAKLPAGDIAVYADLAGSPAQPTGTITLESAGRHDLALTATIAPSAAGLAVTTTGSLGLDRSTLATLHGTLAVPPLFRGRQLDLAGVRRGLTIDTVIDIPERAVASIATLRPKLAKLAKLDGTLGGRIAVRGAVKTPAIDASLAWRGYRTATGSAGETTLAATGTPAALHIAIGHGKALEITADIDRSAPDRIAIAARARAAKAALLPLLPAFAADKLAGAELGTLDWNMDVDLVLARGAHGLTLDRASATGTLDVAGGAFAIPRTKRRYHDIALAVAGEPGGIRIKSLTLHESDRENRDRTLAISGLLALDNLRPQKLDLALAARDWLVFGGEKLGMADAPRATATFDIGVAVDLTSPIIGVDATVHSLAFRSPDRQERAHYAEHIAPGGDIIYVDGKRERIGKLPVAPPVTAGARKRRPLDVRVHIPHAIRLEQTPMDVMTRGELAITVRDEGITTRGTLTMDSGTLNLFGHDHALVSGSVTFSDEHPRGWMEMTFERELPAYALRDLASSAGGARISFAGSPTKPKTSLSGGAGAAMMEMMAMYNAGRPVSVARPGQPASAVVEAPRGDQLLVLAFMASNLPHLLFLDRISAWADPTRGYGQITNVEAERYAADHKSRVRAVVRPTTPGRSNAELQYDRLLLDNDRAAFGVGVRAGDRLGGGVGVFLEWSSR